MTLTLRTCNCGSGLEKYALNDARGIFCTYACEDCEKEKMKEFRPEVFSDMNYEHDEPIDEDVEVPILMEEEDEDMNPILWRVD